MIYLKDLVELIKDFDGEDNEFLENGETLILNSDEVQYRITLSELSRK